MQFKKGNPGKPKGAITTTTKLMKEVWVDVFNEAQNDPKTSLKAMMVEHPLEFYKLAIRIIPTQVNINANVALQDEPIVFD
jgi:hypothetical protein